MHRTYLVQMPRAEARHLAGIGSSWPASPEARCVHAIREWLHGLQRRHSLTVCVTKVVDDLTAILLIVPQTDRPARGPFAAAASGPPLPGHVEYLGAGIVRLDDIAISALAGLAHGEDFRVTMTDAVPVLTVGTDSYPAREEDPDAKP